MGALKLAAGSGIVAPMPDPRALDPLESYVVGEQVRHPDYGIGMVTQVFTVCIDVKFPRHGSVRYPLLPHDAVEYLATSSFATGQTILHPNFGAGVVGKVLGDRIEVRFPIGKKLLVHRRG